MANSSLVGTNLAPVVYWSTEFPFVDRMKSAGNWGAAGTNAGPVVFDKNGYPVAMPTNATYLTNMVALDPQSAGTNNVYVLTYTGTANFRIPGNDIISSKPGEIVFRHTGSDAMQLIMMSGIDPANPPTEIHLVRQDQLSLFQQGEIFNPTFLDKLAGYSTLRYMDWSNTNDSTIVNWSDRTTPNSATWAIINSNSSVPLEVMVSLANRTKTDLWLNVPTMANDDYVRQMMIYANDHLDAGLKIHVEYSNEVWNWGFSQSRYSRDMANKLWGTDVNNDGVIDPNDAKEAVPGGWLQYYGYRSAQIAKIAMDVVGAAGKDRVSNVLATQVVNVGIERSIFAGIERANLGAASSLFSEYAITTYFAWSMSGSNSTDRATLLSWARGGDAGIQAAIDEMKTGGALSNNTSIASLAKAFAYQGAVAAKYGLDLVAYEGGLHINAMGFSADEQKEILSFYQRLQLDPRMADVYTKMVDDFSAAGGKLLLAFTDAQSDRPGGLFGTLDSIYDNGTPAYNALKAAQARALAARGVKSVASPVPTPTPTPTPTFAPTPAPSPTPTSSPTPTPTAASATQTTLATYVMGATEKAVTYVGTQLFTATGNALDNTVVAANFGSKLAGGAGADTLLGGTGADILDGGAGADTMTGLGGDDVYIVDDAGDQVVEAANGGRDEVRTALSSYTLAANVETLTYTGTAGFTGTGNALDNVLNGGDGGARLSGAAGNDILTGGKGADVLDGGTGDDAMTGGAGNDIYVVDSVNDTVNEVAGGGTDEVRTTLASYTLGAAVENLTYGGSGTFTGTGNALANVLTAGSGGSRLSGGAGADSLFGGAGADYLDGGTGADRMAGGAGNDTYIVDDIRDVVTETVSAGSDEVRTTLAAYSLGANVENLTYIGSAAFMGMGNALDNVITGGSAANRLNGGDGNDTLVGGGANDILDGGRGIDRMAGGAGGDTYLVDNAGDVVIEDADAGHDTVFSTVTYTLGDNIEWLRLSGTGAIDGTGNALDNTIAGNAADNRLWGGAGNDSLIGNGGDDILDGGDGNDGLNGGAGNDRLVGGVGGDMLLGGDGNDVLIGGAGVDSLTGGSGADRFVFNPGDLGTVITTTDKVLDFNRTEGDKIDLSGFDADAGSAQRDAFTFVGSAAFSKHAGELRVDDIGGYWNVSGDLNGDGVADFVVNISKGSGSLIASDFVL